MLRFSVPVHCLGAPGVGTTTLVSELCAMNSVIETPTLSIEVKFVEHAQTYDSFAVLFVYDITDKRTFDSAAEKLKQSPALVKVIVGTHRDRQEDRSVRFSDVYQLEQSVSDVIWLETGTGCSNAGLLHEQICTAVQFRVGDVMSRNDTAMLRIIGYEPAKVDNEKPTLILGEENADDSQLQRIARDQQYERQFFFDDPAIQDNFEEPAIPRAANRFEDCVPNLSNQYQLSHAFEAFLKASNMRATHQQIEQYITYLRGSEQQKQTIAKLQEELRNAQLVTEKSAQERQQKLQSMYEKGLRAIKSNRQIIEEKEQRIQQLQRQLALVKSSTGDSQRSAQNITEPQNDLALSNIENITPIQAEYSGVYLGPKQHDGVPVERPQILQAEKTENVLDGMRFKKLERQLRDVAHNKIGAAPVENVRLMTGQPSPELLVREYIDLINSRIVPTKAITLNDICASAERGTLNMDKEKVSRAVDERTVVLNNTYYQVKMPPGQDAFVTARQFLQKRRLAMTYLDEVANQLMRSNRATDVSQRPLFSFTVKVDGKICYAKWYKNDSLQKVARRIMVYAGANDRYSYENVCAYVNKEYIKHQ